MNEIDRNLLTGEQIVFQTTKHWFAPVRDSGVAIVLIIASFFIRWLSPSGDGFILGPLGNILDLAANVAVIVGIGWIVFNVFAFFSAHFGVTNLRVLRKEGIIQRRSSETLLTALTDVRLKEPALGRMLGFGDVDVFTAAGNASKDAFETIRDAPAMRTAIQEQQIKAKTGGRPMAAPDAMPGAAPMVAVAPAPVAPAATAPSSAVPASQDVAAALANVTALRDQGLITPEEYEAKRAEILGRI